MLGHNIMFLILIFKLKYCSEQYLSKKGNRHFNCIIMIVVPVSGFTLKFFVFGKTEIITN